MRNRLVVFWRAIFLPLAAMFYCGAASAQGGISFYETIAPGDEIVDTRLDLLVVTVRKVSQHKPTRANPPIVEVAVDETLRGKKAPKKLSVLWEHPFDKEEYRNTPDHPDLRDTPDEVLDKLADEPVTSPVVNQKWILLGEPYTVDGKLGGKFWIFRKYMYSDKKYKWAVGELARAKLLAQERAEYWNTWPGNSYFSDAELLSDARRVTDDTKLEPGDPVMIHAASLSRCRVVKVFDDGRVKVRPIQHDSRWDSIETREKLLLYPQAILKEPVPLPKRHKPDDIPRYANVAKFIFVGHIVSGAELDGKPDTVDYTFQIGQAIKGKPAVTQPSGKSYVTIGVSRELGFLLRSRDGSYVLFLEDVALRSPSGTVYQQISLGDGLVPADRATLDLLEN